MPIVAADWTVTRSTKVIDYIGDAHGGAAPSYATVLELHRWLSDLADDPSSTGDDQLQATDLLPSDRQTDRYIRLINGYTLTTTAVEHLYGGSIVEDLGGANEKIYDGIVNYGNSGIKIQLIQNGVVIANDWWNLASGLGVNEDPTRGISHQFLLLVSDAAAGGDIDGRRLIGFTREWGKTYKEFTINGTDRGNNTLALDNGTDLNNASTTATVAGWITASDFSNTEGYGTIDIDGDGTGEPYYSAFDKAATRSQNDFYEYCKYLQRDGSAETLYGLSGELFRGITHEIPYGSLAGGTFNESASVTFGNGATAQILADNGVDKMWIQLLTGVAPSNTDTITQGAVTATVGTGVTSRTISPVFCGSSTGSRLIAAYGLGMVATDVLAGDKFTDLNNTQRLPKDQQTWVITNAKVGESYILVAPWDGTTTDPEGNPAINKNQMTLQTALTGNETAIVVDTIPKSTPDTGTLRVVSDAGQDILVNYTAVNRTTNTFTVSHDFTSTPAAVNQGVFLTYIDKLATATSESFTAVYESVDVDLVVVVRDGGTTPEKQFISPSAFSSSGGSVSIIHQSDA